MPVVDMPIEKLREYRGTNPKPADFKEFWQERIIEANNVKLEYTIKESDIKGYSNVDFLELWFTGIDGGRVYAKYLKPKSKEKIPAILQFHGYPGASRGWFEQLSFVGMGFAIFAMDCPGQGGNGDSFNDIKGTTVSGHIIAGLDGEASNMYYVKLFQNTIILFRIVEILDEIDKERIYANGASQGAAIALACTALNKNIKKCAALYPFLSDYKRVWDMDLDLIAYEGLRYYSKWFNPMNENSDMFEKLGYIDIKNFMEFINSEILFGTGLMDNICPPSTQFAVYNNINSKKKHVIFQDYTHEEIGEFDDMLIDFFLEEVE